MLNWDNKESRRMTLTMLAFGLLLVIGTLGYKVLSKDDPSLFNCLYMTVITVTTIGYSEVVEISHSTSGRLFTMLIAISGIGLLTYLLSQITAYVIEGNLKITLINRKIEKMVNKLQGHYIICGYGRVGRRIMNDLKAQGHVFVLIDTNEEIVTPLKDEGILVINGDATDDETLEKAGVTQAAGLFVATGLDNQNLIITLSAKLLAPKLRVVCRCDDRDQIAKMKKAGADTVISTACIGGSRMHNEMIQPDVTSMLDELFDVKGDNRSIKSIVVGQPMHGKTLKDINLIDFSETLILAQKRGDQDGFQFNPKRSLELHEGDLLMIMTTDEEAKQLGERMSGEVFDQI
jgi:voltage-gated potassium channel